MHSLAFLQNYSAYQRIKVLSWPRVKHSQLLPSTYGFPDFFYSGNYFPVTCHPISNGKWGKSLLLGDWNVIFRTSVLKNIRWSSGVPFCKMTISTSPRSIYISCPGKGRELLKNLVCTWNSGPHRALTVNIKAPHQDKYMLHWDYFLCSAE